MILNMTNTLHISWLSSDVITRSSNAKLIGLNRFIIYHVYYCPVSSKITLILHVVECIHSLSKYIKLLFRISNNITSTHSNYGVYDWNVFLFLIVVTK